MSDDQTEWEDVESPRVGDYTERLRVPGGWLYRTYFLQEIAGDEFYTVAMVFVPEPQ